MKTIVYIIQFHFLFLMISCNGQVNNSEDTAAKIKNENKKNDDDQKLKELIKNNKIGIITLTRNNDTLEIISDQKLTWKPVNPLSGSAIKAKGKDLFNGNISSIVSNTAFSQITAGAKDLMGQGFGYDVLNRLTGSYTETYAPVSNSSSFAGWAAAGSGTSIYQENLTYDANGNIKSLLRTDGSGAALDNMQYKFDLSLADPGDPANQAKNKATNNKLLYIDEQGPDASGIDDVVPQTGSSISNPNYTYDSKGRMISDRSNQIALITWTAYDKVASVIRTIGSARPNLYFTYDASGKRLTKTGDFPNAVVMGQISRFLV
jgi:hypothetical protein